jgi:hypothetical protein
MHPAATLGAPRAVRPVAEFGFLHHPEQTGGLVDGREPSEAPSVRAASASSASSVRA